jgi:hypothetical protein
MANSPPGKDETNIHLDNLLKSEADASIPTQKSTEDETQVNGIHAKQNVLHTFPSSEVGVSLKVNHPQMVPAESEHQNLLYVSSLSINEISERDGATQAVASPSTEVRKSTELTVEETQPYDVDVEQGSTGMAGFGRTRRTM